MLDIPLGKALLAVASRGNECAGCYFDGKSFECFKKLPCEKETREDGKNVIFKLVDLPEGRDCMEEVLDHKRYVTIENSDVPADRVSIENAVNKAIAEMEKQLDFYSRTKKDV